MATSYKPSCLIGLAFFFDLLLDLFDSLWSSNAYSSPKAVDLVECRASHFNCHAQFEVSITIAAAAMAYRESIVKALPRNSGFAPLMILYLIDNTSLEEIKLAILHNGIQGGWDFLPFDIVPISFRFSYCIILLTKLMSIFWKDWSGFCCENLSCWSNYQFARGGYRYFWKCLPVLEEKVEQSMPLLVHKIQKYRH